MKGVCGLVDITGGIKKKGFKKGMVEDMEQGTAKSQGCQQRVPATQANAPQADPQANNPDILDAVVGQQFLQIMLNDSQHDPVNTRHQGYGQQQIAHGGEINGKNQEHAKDPEEPDFNDHPRHDPGDMGRGGRMGIRQPGVERDKSGLDAKTGNEKQHECGGGPPSAGKPRKRRQIVTARMDGPVKKTHHE